MHEIFIEHSVEHDLRKIVKKDFNRIISAVKLLAKNPRPFGSHKITGYENYHRIKVGDYRIIYEVDDKEKLIKIMRIRHRREVYR